MEIAKSAARYGAAVAAVAATLAEIDAECAEAVRKRRDELKRRLAAASKARGRLADAVAARPADFVRPRTVTAGGVKFGWRSHAARVVPGDSTLDLIKAKLPHQSRLLVRVRENLNVTALRTLDDAELELVGATRVPAVDVVVVEAVEGGDAEARARLLLARQ